MKHITVLKKETVDLLSPKDNGFYADLTLGGAGHLKELLTRAENLTVLAFDIDKNNISEFLRTEKLEESEKVKVGSSTVYLINDNFSKLDFYIEKFGLEKLDGVIADLGWSMDQLTTVEGMSYEDKDADLDMRMDTNLGVKASDLLNALGKNELGEMFKKYSDVYGSQNSKLVEEIKAYRKKRLIMTVEDFLRIVDKAFGLQNADPKGKSRKFQTYSKLFQALRIAVNNEYGNLNTIVKTAFESLKEGGVFSIITFHSGEDKIVDVYFSTLISTGKAEIVSTSGKDKYFRPTVDELLANISARSAKLWGIKKL
ncbi:MAG: 16S rRNA (cytosine(1402)-N(4))-methyltransferase RsmH [Candidatus Dojkabacteria bacterium]